MLIWREDGQRDTEKKEGPVQMEPDIGVIQLQAKGAQDGQEPLETRKRQGRILP